MSKWVLLVLEPLQIYKGYRKILFRSDQNFGMMRFQKDVAVVDTMDFPEDPTALEAVVVLLRMSCPDQTMPCATR